MIARIINRNYNGSAIYLANNFGCKVFFKIGNKYIALMGAEEVPSEVIVQEEQSIPLWKQTMQLQMGKIPQSTSSYNKRYRTYTVSKNELNTCYFELYELGYF